jgi:predicted NBD/HSP70 family sugar kinase
MKSNRKQDHVQVTTFNSKVVRNLNRSVILNLIREAGPISRVRIAELTNLNKSTVSNIVADLLEEQLLREEVGKGGSVGRNPINLHLRTGNHIFGAIYFDSVTTKLAIVDIDGTIKMSVDLETETARPERFVNVCLERLDALRNQFHFPPFTGIGVSVAGIVDSALSKVVFAPNLGWDDLDLATIIRDCCPDVGIVALENDAKASAVAELWFGKHDLDLSSFVFLLVDRGIGAGIVVDKRVLYGESHAAGEFGHMTLIEDGDPCSCGNAGCWEVYASDRATVQRYVTAKQIDPARSPRISMDDIIEQSKDHDPVPRKVLVESAYYIGLGVANIIKSVDPQAIIIGGKITQAWDIMYPEIMKTLKKRAFFGKQGETRILPASLPTPPLLGAAALSIRKFFTDYRVTL